ncbi:MAG: hypothetical protein M3619_30015, partial [Myxococcota bacterium]|nr:hypothetical protein [Myxococcota bacterium]
MRRLRPRERRVLCATAILALGLPIAAAAIVRARTDMLADRLTAAGGVTARIGGIDADLTGSIRMTDVALGELVQVDAIEASVAMGSLLGGQLRADEIRVDGPRVAIRVDQHGDSDLARLARRIARQGAGRSHGRAGGGRGVRRIIVAEGTLTANIAGLGELTADGVELVPDPTGVRVITGPVRLRGGASPVRVDLAFARSAAELVLPEMRFARVLAVAGTGRVDAGTSSIALRDVAVGRLATHGAL